LYPKPNGWGKISVTGLELAGLRGLAHKYGDTLSRGLFDGTVTVRFREDGSGQLNARLVVTDLALKEAPGGPIAQFFGVGAIDMVIAGLQDADGSITIPLDLPIKQNRIAMGDIYLDAMGAMTQVMVVAAASAPLKMAAAMGKMMGIEGKKKPTKLPPVVLAFAPGSSAYDAQSVSRVEQVIRDLQADEHLSVVVQQQFGQDDILRVKERANPSVDEARAIVTELRRKRADLTHLQSEVAGEARGELAAGVAPAVTQATLTRLAAIEREMAQTDDALDSTSDLLRPGADRQANRRTRAAALQLAKERIGVIKTAFNAANLPGASTRVIISPAAFTVSPGPTGQIVISVTRQR